MYDIHIILMYLLKRLQKLKQYYYIASEYRSTVWVEIGHTLIVVDLQVHKVYSQLALLVYLVKFINMKTMYDKILLSNAVVF